ncbi:hypothetical protein [Thermopirellula anaerolimosa]
MNEATKEFIAILISHVRDEAIEASDITWRQLDREHKGFVAKRWEKARQAGDLDELVRMIIADSVDDAIYSLLHAIDEGILPLVFKGTNLTEDGGADLAGFYLCEARYALSKQRTYEEELPGL